jgi:hypothetical protein
VAEEVANVHPELVRESRGAWKGPRGGVIIHSERLAIVFEIVRIGYATKYAQMHPVSFDGRLLLLIKRNINRQKLARPYARSGGEYPRNPARLTLGTGAFGGELFQ